LAVQLKHDVWVQVTRTSLAAVEEVCLQVGRVGSVLGSDLLQSSSCLPYLLAEPACQTCLLHLPANQPTSLPPLRLNCMPHNCLATRACVTAIFACCPAGHGTLACFPGRCLQQWHQTELPHNWLLHICLLLQFRPWTSGLPSWQMLARTAARLAASLQRGARRRPAGTPPCASCW